MSYDLAELARRIENLIRLGRVVEVDYPAGWLRVELADGLTTDWIPWLERRAGADRTWHAPEIGEQVVVFSPSGDLENAVALAGLFSEAHPAPADSAEICRIEFGNGDSLIHDREAGAYHLVAAGPVTVTAGGAVAVVAAGPVTVQAPQVTLDTPETTMTGDLAVAGSITVAGAGGGTSTVISGDVTIEGNLSATGTVMDGGGNSNHHAH